jgi:hypothetical protein
MTPLEKLASLHDPDTFLKPGITDPSALPDDPAPYFLQTQTSIGIDLPARDRRRGRAALALVGGRFDG